MGKLSRDKGKRWERVVATRLRALFGGNVRRGFQSRSGRDGADVEGVPHGLWVECKVGVQPNPRFALRQAAEAAPDGALLLAVIKDDRQAPFVCMPLDHWELLVRRLRGDHE